MKTILKEKNTTTVLYNDEDPSIEEIEELVGGKVGHFYWKECVVVFDDSGRAKEYPLNIRATTMVGIELVGNVGIITLESIISEGGELQ